MGIYGNGIYDNDAACNLRYRYRWERKSGLCVASAIKATVREYEDFLSLGVLGEEYIFAIADIQLEEQSIIFPNYIEQARELAENNTRLLDYPNIQERKLVLNQLLEKINKTSMLV